MESEWISTQWRSSLCTFYSHLDFVAPKTWEPIFDTFSIMPLYIAGASSVFLVLITSAAFEAISCHDALITDFRLLIQRTLVFHNYKYY